MRHPAAIRTAVKQSPTPKQIQLALSLACYCSPDDMDLTRKEFITEVASRINMDLLTDDY